MLKTIEMLISPKFTISKISKPAICLLLPLILVLLLSNSALSQKSHIKFNRITINDGLSLSSVYCIFEDSKGFMWFGTEDGLNKYDGKNFTIYRPDPYDKNSLSYKWTEQIYEDSRGMLWFGSKGGLTAFNPTREIFQQYRYQDQDVTSLSNDTITAIIEDRNGDLWIGTRKGLNRIRLDSGVIERISISPEWKNGPLSRINDLICDDNTGLWVGCDAGLFHLDSLDMAFSKVLFDGKNTNARVLCIAIDSGLVWAGTNNGLVKYN
nr:histidine kinase [Bacteroidota bacterium]